MSTVPSDIDIARAAPIKPVTEIAESVGLTGDDLDLYGNFKAKVHLDVRDRFTDRPQGKYVVVAGIPHAAGRG